MRAHIQKHRRLYQEVLPHSSILTRPAPANHGEDKIERQALMPMRFAHDFSRIPVFSPKHPMDQSQQFEVPPNGSLSKNPSASKHDHPFSRLIGGVYDGMQSEIGGPSPRLTDASPSKPVDVGAKHDDKEISMPPKLTKKLVDLQDLGCGSFKYDIRWELDKPTSKGGLIVQKVEWVYDVKDCDNNKFDMTAVKWYQDYKSPYWEAWEIRAGQKVTTFAQRDVPMDDEFSAPSPGQKTKGIVSVTGTPEFYDNMKMLPDFKVTGKPPAGALPMTWSAPTLTGGTGTIPHSFRKEWECCK